jgi:hypothetical protein
LLTILDDSDTVQQFEKDVKDTWSAGISTATEAFSQLTLCASSLQSALKDIPASDRPLQLSRISGAFHAHDF